jgi:hypothetical protein
MTTSIMLITKEELDRFKNELLSEVKKVFKEKANSNWLRSADVRELLNISDSTLQTMRIGGAVPAYKLGSTWFYKYDEIIKALENGKAGGAE